MKPHDLVGRLVARPWFWALLVGTLFALPLVRTFLKPPPRFPPHRGVLPGAVLTGAGLTRETGEPFGARELHDKVWVAARFSVDDQQPAMRAMLELERRMRKLGDAFELVSIASAGAQAELRSFALNHHTNPRRWAFVSGEGAPRLLAALQLDGSQGSSESELVLVDSELNLRGFYDWSASQAQQQRETMDQLLYDAALLVNRY